MCQFTTDEMGDCRWGEIDVVAHGVKLSVGLNIFCELNCEALILVLYISVKDEEYILVSPASPENAINVCWFNALVLSSEALRMVAPLIAAFEAAMRVKSLPVIPSKTSLRK